MELPKFRYINDNIRDKFFEPNISDLACECCGKIYPIVYTGMFYCEENVEILCPECVSSGRAAEKFCGEFYDFWDDIPATMPREILHELQHKTPSYRGQQQEYVPHCCNDFCQFVDYVGWRDIQKRGLENSLVFCSYNNTITDNGKKRNFIEAHKENLRKNGDFRGYLFQCLHCNRYHLHADMA